jgi:hypothetical protein
VAGLLFEQRQDHDPQVAVLEEPAEAAARPALMPVMVAHPATPAMTPAMEPALHEMSVHVF